MTAQSKEFKQYTPEFVVVPANIQQAGANSVLVGGSFQSQNFTPNQTGFSLNSDGTAQLLSVKIIGTITAGAGSIGGFDIGTDYIRDVANGFGLSSAITGADDVRFWAGTTFAGKDTAPFRVTESGSIFAELGTIGGWILSTTSLADNATANNAKVLIDKANTLIRLGPTSGTYITLDGNNVRFRSSNYVAGVAGVTVEPNLVEAGNLVARATLRGTTFQYDVIAAVGGKILVANSDTLASDMTALDNSTLVTKGTTVWAVNAEIIIRAVTAVGIQQEKLRITDISGAPTYVVERDLEGSYSPNNNPVWKAGTTITGQGSSDGVATHSGGWIELVGEAATAPYISIHIRNGVGYNDNSEVVRLGQLSGFGSFVSSTFGIGIGDPATSNYMTYDTSSGNLIVNGTNLNFNAFYGDGSDGDATISSNTSLSRDMFYRNLTISSAAFLDLNGYRLFVSGTLTNDVSCFVGRVGNNGGNGGNGQSGFGGTPQGGAAGSTAAALAAGSIPGAVGGQGGQPGANAQSTNATQDGSNGTGGGTGTSVAKSVGVQGATGAVGGASGNANVPSFGSATGRSGGAAGGPGSQTGTVYNFPRLSVGAYLFYDILSGASLGGSTGTGGSGAGASGAAIVTGGATFGCGGAGGASGSSGGAGGIGIIFARFIVNNGTITFKGGSGGNGGNGGNGAVSNNGSVNAASGGAGGAGASGGPGGVGILVYNKLSGSGTITAAGGAPGTHGTAGTGAVFGGGTVGASGDGSSGSTGTTGVIIQLQN